AQEAKLDLICQKLQLKSGQTLLDIGCGWGGLVQFAVEKYGVKAVGITISQEQAKLARQRCAGLDIEIREQDYREINAKFDRIVSVGMIEHVGYKNYRQFMQIASQNLHDDGLFLLHTIGGNTSEKHTEPWLEKYIFPNSMIPSARQLTQAAEGIFMLKDWHNFGPDYDPTLMAWHKNFNDHWDQIKHKYDERFFRMWNYYLSAAAGSFRAQRNQLWQIVYSQIDAEVPYQSVR
ncbi:MAG: class I SAM-dependent methyltransferase, partial [Patescibacteria group bacterium]